MEYVGTLHFVHLKKLWALFLEQPLKRMLTHMHSVVGRVSLSPPILPMSWAKRFSQGFAPPHQVKGC